MEKGGGAYWAGDHSGGCPPACSLPPPGVPLAPRRRAGAQAGAAWRHGGCRNRTCVAQHGSVAVRHVHLPQPVHNSPSALSHRRRWAVAQVKGPRRGVLHRSHLRCVARVACDKPLVVQHANLPQPVHNLAGKLRGDELGAIRKERVAHGAGVDLRGDAGGEVRVCVGVRVGGVGWGGGTTGASKTRALATAGEAATRWVGAAWQRQPGSQRRACTRAAATSNPRHPLHAQGCRRQGPPACAAPSRSQRCAASCLQGWGGWVGGWVGGRGSERVRKATLSAGSCRRPCACLPAATRHAVARCLSPPPTTPAQRPLAGDVSLGDSRGCCMYCWHVLLALQLFRYMSRSLLRELLPRCMSCVHSLLSRCMSRNTVGG